MVLGMVGAAVLHASHWAVLGGTPHGSRASQHVLDGRPSQLASGLLSLLPCQQAKPICLYGWPQLTVFRSCAVDQILYSVGLGAVDITVGPNALSISGLAKCYCFPVMM